MNQTPTDESNTYIKETGVLDKSSTYRRIKHLHDESNTYMMNQTPTEWKNEIFY